MKNNLYKSIAEHNDVFLKLLTQKSNFDKIINVIYKKFKLRW